MEVGKVKFIHMRDRGLTDSDLTVLPHGGCTIAYVLNSLPNGTQEIRYAWAECHDVDNFNKAHGRVKAGGRLKSYQHSAAIPYNGEKNSAIVEVLRRHYYEYKEAITMQNGRRPWELIRLFRY
jgi:hypothetical protein